MSPRQSPSTKDDPDQSLKREEVLHRSLRECTSRRLTHFNPCNTHHVPTLTSRVQWDNDNPPLDVSNRNADYVMKDAYIDGRDASLSPAPSEIDELDPSDDDQPRPSTGMSTVLRPSCAVRTTIPTRHTERSSPPWPDSSDTERRQPNFPGNRDIIDGRIPSTSPSPPTRHSAELETPSPVSDVGNGWAPSNRRPSTSLDLHLNATEKPKLREERLGRVGSWRAESAHRSKYNDYSEPYRCHSIRSQYDSHLYYSPSLSSSSAPPSPPLTLPPIHLNATLPVNTGSTPGVMQWRLRELSNSRSLRNIGHAREDSVDRYDDGRSSTSSPQSLPPLLPHIKMMAQGYPPQHPPPGMMPMSVAPPLVPLANPTRNKNAWKDYADIISGPNEQTEFRCIWRVGCTGEVTDHCGYTAKRHLVKRHIETRHLQFKDHICPYCGKAFPQRVSLMIHVNRHTGAKPHNCRYVDCDKTFSDPARRHKHMVEAHGYNPQGPRKRHRTVDSYHANTNFETLAPWTAKGEGPEGAVAKA